MTAPAERQEQPMSKVRPLTKRTMTLSQLQLRTLDVLRKVTGQLHRMAHEDGMSDSEFIDQVIAPFARDINQDRVVLKMHAAKAKGTGNVE